MKNLFLSLAIVLFSTSALASPFLICDPQTGVTQYKVSYDGCLTFQTGIVNAQSDGSISLDLKGLTTGTYNFCLEGADAGSFWSDPSVPLGPKKKFAIPSGIKIVP
jgi:hypothetical protein